ncbi:Chitinase 2 [Dimargaris verticillata]|uniref:chitinase n=1 Tax=Dimargaris verticillata TaxID=2761393 RepID=A0A9W8EBB2_9FUNG|nr:Chitinase 2 [Dimargaris verticillata]
MLPMRRAFGWMGVAAVGMLGLMASHSAAESCTDSTTHNLAMYWGQNPWGGRHLEDSANWEQDIEYYCQDDTIDVLMVSFLVDYNLGSLPGLNFANHCNTTFPDTKLHHCPKIGSGIKECQSRGKKVLLSLGGAEGRYGFQSDDQGRGFAQVIWDMFLGGDHKYRPFDDTVLDGVDLDLEHGGPTGVTAFITELRRLYESDSSKKYLVAGAPQCEFPDAQLGKPLEEAWFDMVFVQFYNNWCGLINFDNIWAWNYDKWDALAKRMVNPDVKMYLGAPASPDAGRGYVDMDRLTHIYQNVSSAYQTLGGIMMWDTSNAWQNFNVSGSGSSRNANDEEGEHQPRSGQNFAQAVGAWLHQKRGCSPASGPKYLPNSSKPKPKPTHLHAHPESVSTQPEPETTPTTPSPTQPEQEPSSTFSQLEPSSIHSEPKPSQPSSVAQPAPTPVVSELPPLAPKDLVMPEEPMPEFDESRMMDLDGYEDYM